MSTKKMTYFNKTLKLASYLVHIIVPVMLLYVMTISRNISAYDNINFWNVRAIDTMKFSRDRARETQIVSEIPEIVSVASKLNPTHIAIGTPYDNEFNRVTQSWVREIHRKNISVWFRGNFSGWEGWFEYPELNSAEEHHQLIYNFITSNAEFFRDGDIFTPIPEPENGLLGDPRNENKQAYLDFLVKSYQTCQNAFKEINKQVICGYYGTNGDIAKEILTPEVVSQLGNVLVIDHYVKDAETFEKDLNFLANKFPQATIVVGEFGAPVPDIHGSLSEEEQAQVIGDFLEVMYHYQQVVSGVNYWVLNEGTTAIVDDNLKPRKAFQTLYDYYNPRLVQGKIVNTLGEPIPQAKIKLSDGHPNTVTLADGSFDFAIPSDQVSLELVHPDYVQEKQDLELTAQTNHLTITLSPTHPSLGYKLRLLLQSITSNFARS